MPGKTNPWYKDGLRFTCRKCGNCCGGAPGDVFVTDREIKRMAKVLDMPEKEFRTMYTRPAGPGKISLREKPGWDCVFYQKEGGCKVYKARPLQCRAWPFWDTLLETKSTWKEEARNCPGMNQGRWYPAGDIMKKSIPD